MSNYALAVKDGGVDVNYQLALFSLGWLIHVWTSPNQEIGIGGFWGVFGVVAVIFLEGGGGGGGGGFAVSRYFILIAINCG